MLISSRHWAHWRGMTVQMESWIKRVETSQRGTFTTIRENRRPCGSRRSKVFATSNARGNRRKWQSRTDISNHGNHVTICYERRHLPISTGRKQPHQSKSHSYRTVMESKRCKDWSPVVIAMRKWIRTNRVDRDVTLATNEAQNFSHQALPLPDFTSPGIGFARGVG
jgi:hypothetical protein